MMTQDTTIELAEAVENVLDVQAFMFAENADLDELDPPEESCLHSSISFEGETCGRIDLIFPQELCVELAANVLGIEAEEVDDDEDAEDALKELLNVICGQFLTRHFGSEPVFHLTIPQVESLELETWEEWKGRAGTTGFEVDFSPVLVHLMLEEN